MGVAVGIDLGTTNSCVAIVQGDQAKIVESVYGDRIHPSIICFHPSGDVLAGPKAKERLAIDPENTIYSFKRLLGQDVKAPEIQRLISHLPYNVIERNGIPVLQTRNKEATLPEVSALMLKYLREMCEETYGVKIDEAIITVPANFTDVQRASTKIAGRIAGFNVLRILNEPTAAALAYGFGGDREERIAVYDFGGGTFDITIIELLDDIFEVLSTAGDNFLGGDDFDDKIIYEMLTQFKKQHGFSIEDNPVAMQRIRSVAERAKCQLSSIPEVNAMLRELVADKRGRKIDFSFSITRERFEALGASLVERSLATCEEALELAKLTPKDLDNIVLVGGSTRIPLIRRQVEEFFGKKPQTQINPDEVVAIGAAINAFSLTQEALDPKIVPRKKANLKIDPFATHSSRTPANSGQITSEAPPAVAQTAGNRPSTGLPPQRTSTAASGLDPFSSNQSPLADMQDPFADKKPNRPSPRPPKPLGKIDLGKKQTMIGMNSRAAATKSTTGLGHHSLQEDGFSDLPTLIERTENADLPALRNSSIPDDDLRIPIAQREADNELDIWGSIDETTTESDAQKRESSISRQLAHSMANDPDLPVPVDKPSRPSISDYSKISSSNDVDLPIPMPELPVPAAPSDKGADLPIPVGELPIPAKASQKNTDLPIPMPELPIPMPELPGRRDAQVRDQAFPVEASSDEFDLEIDMDTDTADFSKASPSISSHSSTSRPDSTASFGRTRISQPQSTNSASGLDKGIPTGEFEALDEDDIAEIPMDKSGTGMSSARDGYSKALHSRPQTSPQRGFGQIDTNGTFARKSIPPAFDSDLAPDVDGPRMPSYHPYHPLDEVVGDDGKEAQKETHEAFSVPIRNATPAVLLDVSPRGLGIATAGGYCDIIIERNAAIPVEQSRHFSTSRDNQTEVFIDVYQGESRRTEDNTLLGRIEMRDLRAASRGEISILVTFEVDTDGILNVRALNEETKQSQSTRIKLSGALADDQVQALVEKYAGHAK